MSVVLKCKVCLMVLPMTLASAQFCTGRGAGGCSRSRNLQRAFSAQDAAAFREPPVFRPEPWFHFIGRNVATEAITADLETIAGAGIEKIQLFYLQLGRPWPGVEPQIKCLGTPWDGAVRHVALECRQLGLRFTMQNCPGWAMAGGTWITPESRADVLGGSNLTVTLLQPQPSGEDWRDYREVGVVAFPTPDGDTGQPLVPVSVPDLPWEKCLRDEGDGKIILEPGTEPVWVEATFANEVTLRGGVASGAGLQSPMVLRARRDHRWNS